MDRPHGVSLLVASSALLLLVFIAWGVMEDRRLNATPGLRGSAFETAAAICGEMCRMLRTENKKAMNVKRVKRWDMSMYDSQGAGAEPIVIEGTAKDWPALKKWSKPDYLLSAIAPLQEQPQVFVTHTPYIRGTDGGSRVSNHPELIFGVEDAPKGEHRYLGLFSIRKLPALLQDLEPRPSFLTGNTSDSPAFDRGELQDCIWASNGIVDSGLHFDENGGGFLTQVVGTKEVLMFPNDDTPLLYLRKQQGHHMESFLFMHRDLPHFRRDYPLLSQTTPYVVTLAPGDTLYIPHKWFHEVVSSGRSVAHSSWVHKT